MANSDTLQFLEKSYGIKEKTPILDISFPQIEEETQELRAVLGLLFVKRYEEAEFKQVINQIHQAIESFGFDRFVDCFLKVNKVLLSGNFEYNNLSEEIQDFMQSTYHCIQRLNDHLPDVWHKRKKYIDSLWEAQIVELHGEKVVEIFLTSLKEAGNPDLTQEQTHMVLKEMLQAIKTPLTYKFRQRAEFKEIMKYTTEFMYETVPGLISYVIQQKS